MKKRNLVIRLNIIHLSHFILGMIFILVVNYFLIKDLFLKDGFNNYLFIYLKNIGIFFLILIFIFSYLIILTNLKHTKPFSEIADSLMKTNDLKNNFPEKMSESKTIRKGIDLLQNQLNQYRLGLEKSIQYQQKIENDLRLAKRLQKNILPKDNTEITRNKSFKIFADYEAAFDVGGDFYDYFMLDDDHLLITIADVAGKGIPASLFMIYTQTMLRSIIQNQSSVSEITEVLNNRLIDEKISDLFVTIFIGIYQISDSTFTFCNAAHNFPLLIKENGTIGELSETHGIPIGIYPNRKYTSSTIKLEPNDQLFLYTDGLVDLQDENNIKFSVDVLKYNLMGSWFLEPKEVVEKIKDCAVSFRGNRNPEDDMTILSIKFTPGLQ